MSGPDFRQQQELEEERAASLLTILVRVAHGESTEHDALELACELGLTMQYHKEIEHEMG